MHRCAFRHSKIPRCQTPLRHRTRGQGRWTTLKSCGLGQFVKLMELGLQQLLVGQAGLVLRHQGRRDGPVQGVLDYLVVLGSAKQHTGCKIRCSLCRTEKDSKGHNSLPGKGFVPLSPFLFPADYLFIYPQGDSNPCLSLERAMS